MTEVTINNKDKLIAEINNLFAYLENPDAKTRDEHYPNKITFVDFPRFEFTLGDKNYKGGIPGRIMPAFSNLQEVLNDAYASLIYDGKQKSLTEPDLKSIELTFSHQRGSIKAFTELAGGFNYAIANMSGTQTLLAILGVALICSTADVWKEYIKNRLKQQKTIQQLETDHELLNILASLEKKHPHIKKFRRNILKLLVLLMSKLYLDDDLFFGDEHLLNGKIAKELTELEHPTKPDYERLNSLFLIVSVYHKKNKDVSIHLRNTATNEILTTQIPRSLPESEKDLIKSWEWLQKPLRMKIDVYRKNGKVTKAELISVSNPDQKV